MTSFLCDILLGCVLALPGAQPIDELTYGTALYAYYQHDYDQALLEVMVAESRGRTGDDPLRFDLAKGSFAFQQGMYRFATETFDVVADAELTELDRMRLAFHVSREHYRRGNWPALEDQLQRIRLGPDWRGRERRHPEVSFMRAEAAMARGDLVGAKLALAELPAGDDYLAYGLFNLGVAERQAGDAAASEATFRRLAALKVDSEEAWDLVQRGRLALAMMARQQGEALDAESLLGSLPGEGRYRELALASYGNLAMAREDHELAARIWLTLLKQPGWSRSLAAAHLGLPMSLEKLASTAHALERYRAAERAYEARLAALQDAAGRARDGAWIDRLLDTFADPDASARMRELGRLGEGLGRATWLEWLSRDDVHRVPAEWRELDGMASWLGQLPPRIAAYREITRERRRRTAAAGELLNEERLAGRRSELAQRLTRLEADLADLEREAPRPEPHWMNKLANEEEGALIARLSAMAELVATRMPAADRPRFEARIRRLMGVLFWQIADDRAGRVRVLVKRLRDNRSLLADIDQRVERLAEAEARFSAGVETDFVALTARSNEMSERVATALDHRRRIIAGTLERSLEEEMRRTRQYLLTARIAIARATDQLASAGAGES